MGAESNKIIMALFQYSVVEKGIEKKLKDAGYEVITLTENLKKAENYVKEASLFMAYLSEDILDDYHKTKDLTTYCEIAHWSGINLVLIGEEKFRDDMVTAIPSIDSYVWLNRPIDLERLPDMVQKAIAFRLSEKDKKRILIVDDDPIYTSMVKEWLKDTYWVDSVTAGMQAITFLLKNKVDLILLDYDMPVIDGPQVLQMLRQEKATRKIPVVFLTGIGTRESVSRVMELKPDGYILKSTTKEKLLSNLNTLMTE